MGNMLETLIDTGKYDVMVLRGARLLQNGESNSPAKHQNINLHVMNCGENIAAL